ncbi:MAG: hypothetical protein AAGN82_10980, partial [Myxococcota bacterium]
AAGRGRDEGARADAMLGAVLGGAPALDLQRHGYSAGARRALADAEALATRTMSDDVVRAGG